jgi:signal transduction histidine kinase
MRIATRITVTATALVAIALAGFGWVRGSADRRDRLERRSDEAAQVAAALRAGIEVQGRMPERLLERSEALTRGLARAGLPWRVTLIDVDEAPPPDAPPTGDPRRERLRKLLLLRSAIVDERASEDGRRLYVHLEPVRVPSAQSPDGFLIIGAIELARPLDWRDRPGLWLELWVSLAVIGALVAAAVYLSASRGIGKPIQKLIVGIDDVARGDLSHVVLQERDDELGALASRFNDMTASLRGAREEARRAAEQRSQLELHLRGSEKMATVGQIAAEIAHEVGTPLNVVTGRARAMARKAEDPDAVQKNASIIAEQAARIARIIQRLLDFARRKVGDAETAEVIDLARLAGDTLEFLDHHLESHKVTSRLVVGEGLGAIAGSKDQIQQVLLNLCMNAIQAMPGGGELALRLSQVVRRRPGLELAPEQAYVVLEVADTGVGIAAEDRDKIFEPFYTSKSDTGGSGLGLAVTHGIVKDHDGWMEVAENDLSGRGTVFKVFLPVAT